MLYPDNRSPQNVGASPLLSALARSHERANQAFRNGGSREALAAGMWRLPSGDIEWSSHSPAKGGVRRRREGPQAPVHKTAKSVGHGVGGEISQPSQKKKTHQETRMDRFRWQRHAAFLMNWEHRIGLCKYAIASNADGVTVKLATKKADNAGEPDVKRAFLAGLQTCGSVWGCPCCSMKISEGRRGEMNALLKWSREQGYVPMMMTLTARHGRGDDLAELLEKMKKAKKRLHQHRRWKSLKVVIVGSVTATEITGGGRHGWHPHFHVILLVKELHDTDLNWQTVRDLEGLCDAWLASLAGVGLSGTGDGFDLQGADEAGKYIAKWGAAEEMVMSGQKSGRGSESRTPMQLLADSCDEDDWEAGQLWREYMAAFQGRRQLVWSRGLKAAAGLQEKKDDELAEEEPSQDEAETQQPEQDVQDLHHMEAGDWVGDDLIGRKGARWRRGLILNAAENEGAAGIRRVIAERGHDPRPEPAGMIDKDDDPKMWITSDG